MLKFTSTTKWTSMQIMHAVNVYGFIVHSPGGIDKL